MPQLFSGKMEWYLAFWGAELYACSQEDGFGPKVFHGAASGRRIPVRYDDPCLVEMRKRRERDE
jgi:hypothetical protein